MKKLKLHLGNLPGTEILSREQLKKIIGGDTGSTATSTCAAECTCPDGWITKEPTPNNMYNMTVECKGKCTAEDEVGVSCDKANGETESTACETFEIVIDFCKPDFLGN